MVSQFLNYTILEINDNVLMTLNLGPSPHLSEFRGLFLFKTIKLFGSKSKSKEGMKI